MIGENDKSMLERFKKWLKADFVLPKIKFTRKPKIKITELEEEKPIPEPLLKLPAEPKIEESDELRKCREALDNGMPIYAYSKFSLEAKMELENTIYKCGRNKEDIKILFEGWEGKLYIIKAVDRNFYKKIKHKPF